MSRTGGGGLPRDHLMVRVRWAGSAAGDVGAKR